MSGLGLTAALQDYQQGVAWNDQQKQQAVANKQLATIQQANAAGAQALQQAHDADVAQQQQAWTDAGNDPSTFQPKPFQMTPQVLLAGMHARSDALAQSGDLDLWTRNEAASLPIRNQIRQQVIGKALADYDATGDGAALAKAAYPTVHDGVDITNITTDPTGGLGMQGASAAAANGQPIKPVYNISLSNGTTQSLTGDQIAAMAHDAIMDPSKLADIEFQSRIQAAKTASEMAVNKAKAAAEGDQARQTEGVKGANAMQVEGLKSNTALQVGQGNNAATLGAAGLRADAEKASAGISAGGRVDAAKIRAGASGDGAKKVQRTGTDSNGYVVNYFKDGSAARALDNNGQPILSSDYAKRVDSMARSLAGQPGNMKKSPTELRAMATQALSGAPAPAASGLVAPPPPAAPGLGAPPPPTVAVPSVSNW